MISGDGTFGVVAWREETGTVPALGLVHRFQRRRQEENGDDGDQTPQPNFVGVLHFLGHDHNRDEQHSDQTDRQRDNQPFSSVLFPSLLKK